MPPCNPPRAPRCRLEWLRALQQQLGARGVSPAAQRVFFDPVAPGLTAARFMKLLHSMQHMLQVEPCCHCCCH